MSYNKSKYSKLGTVFLTNNQHRGQNGKDPSKEPVSYGWAFLPELNVYVRVRMFTGIGKNGMQYTSLSIEKDLEPDPSKYAAPSSNVSTQQQAPVQQQPQQVPPVQQQPQQGAAPWDPQNNGQPRY